MDKTRARRGRALERRLGPKGGERGAPLRAGGFGVFCGDGICRGAGFGAEERTSKPPGRSHFLCSPSSNLFHIAVPEQPLPPLAASRLAVTAVSPRLPLQRFPSQRKKERQKKKEGKKKKRKMSSKDLRKQLFWFLFWSGYS